MRLYALACWVGATVVVLTQSNCAVHCIEDASGTKCVAKSLKRFDGPPPAVQAFDPAPGMPLTVDVNYGNVALARSNSGRIEVQFQPYAYAGYDEKATADQQLAQNLRVAAVVQNGLVVSSTREGGTNGLGADVIVRLPDQFDGPITIVNHGNGPVNNFDVRVDAVGRAVALNVNNKSVMGACHVQGSPSVVNTTVDCGSNVTVYDVSDTVQITNRNSRHSGVAPAVTLRLARTAAGGGRVLSASGAISASFPKAGGYLLTARATTQGSVTEGALPPGCAKNETSPQHKTVTCGSGPHYELTAGFGPTGGPRDSNVLLAYH